MTNKKFRLNLLFGSVVVLLAGTAVTGMYTNRNLPPILEAPAAVPDTMALPENHPPIDAGAGITALEKVARENPQDADIRTQIANAYYDAGRFDKAVEAYQESLRLHPNDPAVQTDLATSYHYLGQHDKALELLEQVLKSNPGFAQALYNKGVILQAGKNNVAGAIAAWEALLRTDPNYPQRAELEKKISELKAGMR